MAEFDKMAKYRLAAFPTYYWVGTIAKPYSAVSLNSAVRFGRLVVYFQPFGFYFFGRPDSAFWPRPIPTVFDTGQRATA